MTVSFAQRLAGLEAELESIDKAIYEFVTAVQAHEPQFGVIFMEDGGGAVFGITNRAFTYTMMVDYWTDDDYTDAPPNKLALAEFHRFLPTEEEGNALLRLMDLLHGEGEDE